MHSHHIIPHITSELCQNHSEWDKNARLVQNLTRLSANNRGTRIQSRQLTRHTLKWVHKRWIKLQVYEDNILKIDSMAEPKVLAKFRNNVKNGKAIRAFLLEYVFTVPIHHSRSQWDLVKRITVDNHTLIIEIGLENKSTIANSLVRRTRQCVFNIFLVGLLCSLSLTPSVLTSTRCTMFCMA